MEWISVKEKAPEFDIKVLVYRHWISENKEEKNPIGMIDVGYLQDTTSNRYGTQHEWKVGDDYDIRDVTHWQPLPEPPKV